MKYLICILSLLFAFNLSAQDLSAKKHVKLAEEYLKKGKYIDAGDHFKLAYKQKPNKKDNLYKAAEAYFEGKDYHKSEIAYRQMKKEFDEFPGSELMYARCLKQQGHYEEAKESFSKFIRKYKEADKPLFSKIVKIEIAGCDLAINDGVDGSDSELSMQYVSDNINSSNDDFAPIPFSDDILYFSTVSDNNSKIMRSQKTQGEWMSPVSPDFPTMPEGHVANGSFSPDGKRFYFTVCETSNKWKGLDSNCDLHVMIHTNGKWAAPTALRTYLKMDGSTATHPYVTHADGKEILYFSSNRSDGKGGMDIWYTTRKLSSDDFDFDFPKNAGSKINTLGDEITPFYDDSEGKLYFSSNGHPGYGGFDVFASGGNRSKFTEPEHLQAPINSPEEDLYYVKTPSKNRGFLVSNRLTGVERVATTEYDIFSFSDQNIQESFAFGKIIEKGTVDPLDDVQVVLYEFKEFGGERLLASKMFEDGKFSFKVLPNKEYKIEASRDGYMPRSYIFSTADFKQEGYQKDLALETSSLEGMVYEPSPETETAKGPSPVKSVSNDGRVLINGNTTVTNQGTIPGKPAPTRASEPKETVAIPTPVKQPTYTAPAVVETAPTYTTNTSSNNSSYTTPTYTAPAVSNYPSNNNSSSSSSTSKSYSPSSINPHTGTKNYTNSRYKNDGVTTSAPKLEGTYYKVQLTVVLNYDEAHSTYQKMQKVGRLDTEYIIEKKWMRVLVADFFTIPDATEVVRQAQINGFPEAFVVKYVNGRRIN